MKPYIDYDFARVPYRVTLVDTDRYLVHIVLWPKYWCRLRRWYGWKCQHVDVGPLRLARRAPGYHSEIPF